MLCRRTRKGSVPVVDKLGWWVANISPCLSGDDDGRAIVAGLLVLLRRGEGQEDGFVVVVV
jgi:hypothetical protein